MDYLKKIHTSGEHLLSLINDVLDMSRIESGSVQDRIYNGAPAGYSAGFKNDHCWDLYIPKSRSFILIYRMYCHEDIITDKLRLTQVLLNISGNAVKVYTGRAV